MLAGLTNTKKANVYPALNRDQSEVVGRRRVPPAAPRSSSGGLPGESLSRDDETESVQRLAVLSAVFGAMVLIAIVVRELAAARGWQPNLRFSAVATGVSLVAGLALLALAAAAHWRLLPARRVLVLGGAAEVLLVLAIAFIERLMFDFGQVPIPLSITVLVFLLFPVTVAQPRRRRYVISGLSLAALPLGNLAASLLLLPVRDWSFWAFSFIASLMAGLAGLVAWRVVFRLRLRLRRARRLGSYELEHYLGDGGMGQVWRARHRLLARPAAVKLVRPELLERNAEVLARFEREAHVTARLRSPHTVELYDFGRSEDGTFYYVMELLEGVNLAQLVGAHGPVPAARAAYILRQVCRSLGEAHAAGLVHRDIKPENVFLCRLGGQHDVVKVLDFGLVKPLDAAAGPTAAQAPDLCRAAEGAAASAVLTQDGTIQGTPAFMAPEQIQAGVVDARADIYALGGVAFWLLTGRPAFEATSLSEMLVAQLERVPPVPSTLAPSPLPEALDRLVLACLEKDPARRPASVDLLARDLDRVLEQEPWTEAQARRWWEATDATAAAAEQLSSAETVMASTVTGPVAPEPALGETPAPRGEAATPAGP